MAAGQVIAMAPLEGAMFRMGAGPGAGKLRLSMSTPWLEAAALVICQPSQRPAPGGQFVIVWLVTPREEVSSGAVSPAAWAPVGKSAFKAGRAAVRLVVEKPLVPARST